MVRLLFTLIFIHVIVLCAGQKAAAENKILFSASFNKDSVSMGASLKITIAYKNDSNPPNIKKGKNKNINRI